MKINPKLDPKLKLQNNNSGLFTDENLQTDQSLITKKDLLADES